MLKALELNGFKSFADRSRLEFPNGITAVVGPNGSGKSNVVDAIKWVLGNQSVKALRGNEMTDVIFSGSRTRKQANAAEVTLSFDNSTGVLNSDDEEVHVTRRVYRSGEGEYLINRQPCRLRDIREIFSGIGVTTGAYSIIEQGKVDALLQSSPKDRRLIFEEAAGVSRFKLKRQEAARRLERIDQNLLRLSDIVEELDSRLRSVRSQAGKARKYKEHADRLRHLRTQVGLADWRNFSADLQKLEARATEMRESHKSLQSSSAELEEKLSSLEQATDEMQQQIQQAGGRAGTVRERIAHCESTRRSQSARYEELQEESERLGRQILAMSSRAGSAQQMVAETFEQLQAVEKQFSEFESLVLQEQSGLDQALERLTQCRSKLEECRDQHNLAYRKASQLEHQIQTVESQHQSATAACERLRQQEEQANESRTHLAEQAAAVNERLREQAAKFHHSQQELARMQQQLRDERTKFGKAQSSLAELKNRFSGAKERANVLEELERRLDGLSAGTKEVLRLAHEEPGGPFGKVLGIVADLLRVDADTASLVEIALGDRANFLVLRETDDRIFSQMEEQWQGRTSFLRLDVPHPASPVDRIDLSAEVGVIGRADRFVEVSPELGPLARRLLSRHWFVDSLPTAFRLSRGTGRGLNFVTVLGEFLGIDGTLTVGPRKSAMGLLSRRSELRALLEETNSMQHRIEKEEQINRSLEAAIEAAEQGLAEKTNSHNQLSHQVSETRLKATSAGERLSQADKQLEEVKEALAKAEHEQSATFTELANEKQQLTDCLQAVEDFKRQEGELTVEAASLDQQVASLQAKVTDLRVALARGEQRRDGLRRQMEQLHRDHEEHDRALSETRERASECRKQQRQLKQCVLDLSSELAELYREKEIQAAQLASWNVQYEQQRKQRMTLFRQVEHVRKQLLERQNSLQQAELKLQQVEHLRQELFDRLAEDYQIDLAVLAATEPVVELGPRDAVDSEIRSLRDHLHGIGPVSLESLTELEAIEDRHSSLAQQYHDLKDAKARLEQLVTQINIESRDVFVKTLEVIRGHFQELYRNLFGGGEADILVEESPTEDTLECGIEIIARPPGKQPRSISLLSGGERTMTCVALLLAIFRSRPTPFCVLDEVDAALDEANIDRFVEVLKQFMSSTQFIVVTHSKRTMACADTLYGITMQESGISKKVSVRFEDVTADGHIRQAA